MGTHVYTLELGGTALYNCPTVLEYRADGTPRMLACRDAAVRIARRARGLHGARWCVGAPAVSAHPHSVAHAQPQPQPRQVEGLQATGGTRDSRRQVGPER
eukprot:SAG31_NODE_4475_length_3202_cov_23.547713_3_plen_101_part_00